MRYHIDVEFAVVLFVVVLFMVVLFIAILFAVILYGKTWNGIKLQSVCNSYISPLCPGHTCMPGTIGP